MRRLPSLQWSVLIAICALASLAATAEAQSNLAYGQWTNAGLPTPPSVSFRPTGDSQVDFIIRDGSRGQQYVEGCTSVSNGQQYNQASPLPVGNGWVLNCRLQPSLIVIENFVVGSDGRYYCWRGGAVSYRTVSDPRLQVKATPGVWGQQYWWLQGWSNQQLWIAPVSLQIGTNWPLWLEVSYRTIAFAPAVNNSCQGVLPPLR